MTEDEAHQKTCCGPTDTGQWNEDPYPARWCRGSACMAWRWFNNRDLADNQKLCRVRNQDGTTNVVSKSLAKSQGWEVIADNTGFCGLAGVPS